MTKTRGVPPSARRRTGGLLLAAPLALAAACSSDPPTVAGRPQAPGSNDLGCSIPTSEIFNGGPGKDGIPALTDPATVTQYDAEAGYLRDEDRVVGLVVDGEVVAIPLNILWWHEIVNLEVGDRTLAVTHCPLTGSSLAFDRAPLGGVEFGVSGLLYRNNLIMYDRATQESLWPQMVRGARCGVRDGDDLTMYPVIEATWRGWRGLHPDTRVVAGDTGFDRDYRIYPYGDYARIDNRELLFPLPNVDRRRQPKERVLGIPRREGGEAYPFGELEGLGDVGVVTREDYVVFWDGQAAAAMAYEPTAGGRALTFTTRNGDVVDNQTGSVWQVDGTATAGALKGSHPTSVAEAYVSYWFAWAAFQPDAELWEAP